MWEEQEIRLAQISTIGDVEYPEDSLRLQALESNGPEPQLPASISNIMREAVNGTGCSVKRRKSLARGNREGGLPLGQANAVLLGSSSHARLLGRFHGERSCEI